MSLNIVDLPYYGYPEITVLGVLAMVSVLCFLCLLSKLFRKDPIEIPVKEFENFDYDVFPPQGPNLNCRKVNVTTKIMVSILSGILIYTPLEKLLGLDFTWYYNSSWDLIFW